MSSTPLPARVVRLLVILLTLATALIHMGLAFQIPNGPDFIFLLNGLGYLVLVTLLYWPPPFVQPYRSRVRWALFGYTALTILLWVLIGHKGFLGYLDKLFEAGLLVLLWMEQQSSDPHRG
jgi:hypothetical protein